jgi:hypothetical protein
MAIDRLKSLQEAEADEASPTTVDTKKRPEKRFFS